MVLASNDDQERTLLALGCGFGIYSYNGIIGIIIYLVPAMLVMSLFEYLSLFCGVITCYYLASDSFERTLSFSCIVFYSFKINLSSSFSSDPIVLYDKQICSASVNSLSLVLRVFLYLFSISIMLRFSCCICSIYFTL